jgi:hypothetical protein
MMGFFNPSIRAPTPSTTQLTIARVGVSKPMPMAITGTWLVEVQEAVGTQPD